MKALSTFLLICTFNLCIAQNIVYDKTGKNKPFTYEELEITFDNPNAIDITKFKPEALTPFVAAALPTVADMVFRLTQNKLEKNIKKFTAEYTKAQSNINAKAGKISPFTFERKIKIQDEGDINGLAITFKPNFLDDIGFYYSISNIHLSRSAAKTKKKYNKLDYTIEIKLDYIDDKGQKQIYELTPIVVSYVEFKDNPFTDKHRSEIIPLYVGNLITGVHLKVIESNPYKVRAEKILSLWNDNKDDARTIINNIFPEVKGESEGIRAKGAAPVAAGGK